MSPQGLCLSRNSFGVRLDSATVWDTLHAREHGWTQEADCD